MSNVLTINPPFKFSGNLGELNSLFKTVENFEVIRHSETLSRSTTNSFNLIGSICGYISASKKSEAMMERYAIIEAALSKSLQQYKIRITEVSKHIKDKIQNELNKFKENVNSTIEKLKKEYRIARETLKDKFRLDELKNKIKTSLLKQYESAKEIVKLVLDTFKNIFSDYEEYTRLCDEYQEMERNYIKLLKIEVSK